MKEEDDPAAPRFGRDALCAALNGRAGAFGDDFLRGGAPGGAPAASAGFRFCPSAAVAWEPDDGSRASTGASSAWTISAVGSSAASVGPLASGAASGAAGAGGASDEFPSGPASSLLLSNATTGLAETSPAAPAAAGDAATASSVESAAASIAAVDHSIARRRTLGGDLRGARRADSSAVSRPRARDAKRSSGFRDARPSERRTTSRYTRTRVTIARGVRSRARRCEWITEFRRRGRAAGNGRGLRRRRCLLSDPFWR